MTNDCESCGKMVAVKREPGRMRGADVWFRCSWVGRSEVKVVRVGLVSWLYRVSIVSTDEIGEVLRSHNLQGIHIKWVSCKYGVVVLQREDVRREEERSGRCGEVRHLRKIAKVIGQVRLEPSL